MKIYDEGILIHQKAFGETKVLGCFFTAQHGKITGILRRSSKTMIDLGVRANITWSARLEDQLGTLTFEPLGASPATFCLGNYAALLALQSASRLLYDMLPEKHPYERVYSTLCHFLKSLKDDWAHPYAQFEFMLLQELGFGLSLDACAVSGSCDNLTYVSPKTGRAVSEAEGFAYREKLLPFPKVLRHEGEDLREALLTFGYFLQKHFYTPHYKKMPQARVHLGEILAQSSQKKAS